MNMGRFAEAESELRLSAQQGEGDSGGLLHTLGVVLMLPGRDREAIGYIDEALSGSASAACAWMTLGIAYRRQPSPRNQRRRMAGAWMWLENDAARDPRNAVVLAAPFRVLLRPSGRPRRGSQEVARALQIPPTAPRHDLPAALSLQALSRRKRTLEVLYSAPSEVLMDLSRWPDVTDLELRTPAWSGLLVSQRLP